MANYTILDLFKVQLFSFELSEALLNDTLNKVKNLTWRKNFSNQISEKSLNDMEEFKDLHLFLNECLEEVKIVAKFPFEKIALTQSWANKSAKNEKHHGHIHPNSFISGIIYLTSHSNCGFTFFDAIDMWKNNLLFSNKMKRRLISPKAGNVLIFPSELFHGVTKIDDDEERYTISFNSFPNGKMGKFSAGLNLEIKEFSEIFCEEYDKKEPNKELAPKKYKEVKQI